MKRKKLAVLPVQSSKEISDSARLLYNDIMGPVLASLQAAQQYAATVQQRLGERMAKMDDVNPDDGWRLDVDKMRWVKQPPSE